jgi:hypothetical protein
VVTGTRSGTLNCEYGHAPKRHARRIIDEFDRLHLDVLCLNESRDYNRHLAKLAKARGYRLLVRRTQQGSDQCTALVRAPALVDRVWTFEAGPGWIRQGGGHMAPMQPLAFIYDGVLYVSGHAPVAAWLPGNMKGIRKWIGGALRLASYRGFMRRLALLAKRHPDLPIVMWCDWNATPGTRGPWSPQWLRRRMRGQIVTPGVDTGHGEIDFAIVCGVRILGPAKARFPHVPGRAGWPGDHKLVHAVLAAVGVIHHPHKEK